MLRTPPAGRRNSARNRRTPERLSGFEVESRESRRRAADFWSQPETRQPAVTLSEEVEEESREEVSPGGFHGWDLESGWVASVSAESDDDSSVEADVNLVQAPVLEADGDNDDEADCNLPDPEDDEGYDSFIEERIRPTIPQPDLTAARIPDSDGWGLIARLGPMDVFLTSFPALQEVPEQHHQAWVEAVSQVLRRWKAASTEEETNLALFWFLFLPQGLLRRPNRGGRVGRKQTASRFNCITRGDWGTIIEMWEKDKSRQTDDRERRARRGRGRREGREEEEEERRRREVVSLISSGQISRAMQRVTSHGLASMSDPAVKAQVAAKYPPRGRPLPDRVPRGQPVEHLRSLRDNLKSLLPCLSPGCGGMRPEYLRVLGEGMEEEDMHLLEEFGLSYLQGKLPYWFYSVWLTVQTVPIFKNTQRCAVRPLGLRTPLLKVFHKQVVTQNITEVKAYLEPEQLGMSVAGAQKLVFSVRSLLNSNRQFICCKIDFRNAYNEQSRRACIDAFLEEPSLRHLAHFCAVTLAPVSGLESGGTLWGEAAEGDTQGDSAASMRFCVGLQPSLRRLDAACRVGGGGGMARGGADDITAIGPANIVLPAVEEFAREVRERCLLHWEKTKTEVFTWEGNLPPGTPEGLTLAGEVVDGSFEHGFLMYGVPVGSDRYCTYQLRQIAERIAGDAQQTAKLLAGERQSLWSALRCSISHRFDYWLQMSYPTVVEPVAAWLDTELWRIFESATGLTIPRFATANEWSCTLPIPVVGRGDHSFQEWVVRQPVRMGGFGFRSLVDTAGVAFLGALE